MLLSRSLNSLILGCGLVPGLLALAACDRQAGQPAQGASSDAPSSRGAPAAAAEPARGVDRSHRGSALPALTFADPAGRRLALADLPGQSGGRPVLINLWATWCAPCVKELPTLEALAAAGKIRVVTVSQDSGEPAKVAAFLKDKELTRLEPWLDPDNALAFQLNGGTLPMSVLYGPAGREVWRFTGEQDWTSPAATALLAEAR
ncbi:MAG TPA: TlpA disulfide reductase family protein [Novosphingobium sp.]